MRLGILKKEITNNNNKNVMLTKMIEITGIEFKKFTAKRQTRMKNPAASEILLNPSL